MGRKMSQSPLPLVLSLAVCCLGISAFLTQVALMRELLSVFAGNELVFGIVLGNWMLLTGIGAAVGRGAARLKSPHTILILAQVLVAVLPLADLLLLRTLRNVVFLRGVEVGVTDTVAACCLLLAPYCLVLGYLLTLFSQLLAKDAGGIAWAYFLDNAGSVLAGVLFSFLLVYVFSHFAILYIPAALNLCFAALLAAMLGRWRLLAVVSVITIALGAAILSCDLDQRTTQLQFAPQQVVFHGQSPYGMLAVTQSGNQYNFIENGVGLFSTHDVEKVEETVHYAMAQRPQAKRVLLISGGASGTATEVLKYGVDRVDYVELDPLVIEAARRFVPESLADPRIRVVATDGRLYVKQTADRYDVVILDTAEPSNSQINRFYTREFFAEVRRVLSPGGVLSLSLGHYDGYLDAELGRLLATTERTLHDVFSNVLIVPGESVFFAASDGELTSNLADQIQRAGVATRFVNRPYLAAIMAPSRLADLRRALAAAGPLNRDFSPILYYYHLRYWMSQFKVRFGLLGTVLLVLLAVYLLRLRPVPLAVFATGLAASALEVVLLVGFQVIAGSVYQQVGLIVTMFMLGLGIGSLAARPGTVPIFRSRREASSQKWDCPLFRSQPRRALLCILLTLAIYAACLPAAIIGLGRLGAAGPATARVVVPLLALLLAVLVGAAFASAAKADTPADSEGNSIAATASRLYTADYIGAALGALLVSTLLIPLFGVAAVCLFTAAVAVLSAAILLLT
jgi:spermidine synthase